MYDIIGDIHGHAEALKALLLKMDYRLKDHVWQHPERKAIFVGDYIDRGPEIRETLYIVKNMSDSGAAYALLGNHEYNALAFKNHNPQGGHIREHSIKNLLQHYETIKQFQNYEKEWEDYLAWFARRPLFLEIDGIRVVHACWDDRHIEYLKKHSSILDKDILVAAHKKKSGECKVYDETLKGKEMELPKGHFFLDKDGNSRPESRTRWWMNPEGLVLTDYLFHAPVSLEGFSIPSTITGNGYDANLPPVFFGHYWLESDNGPSLQASNVCCLDYSVANKGKLVAYRWSGEQQLKEDNFIYC